MFHSHSVRRVVTGHDANGKAVVASDEWVDPVTFVTVGTGGHELRVVDPGDGESGYFAASSGRNRQPSFGSLDVQVTADRLTARFVPVDGGTFTDRLVLSR